MATPEVSAARLRMLPLSDKLRPVVEQVVQMVNSGKFSSNFGRSELNRLRRGLGDEVFGPVGGEELSERFLTGQLPDQRAARGPTREQAAAGLVPTAAVLGAFAGPSLLGGLFSRIPGLNLTPQIIRDIGLGSTGAIAAETGTRMAVLGQEPEEALEDAVSAEKTNLLVASPFVIPAAMRGLARRGVRRQVPPQLGSNPQDFIERTESNMTVGSNFRRARKNELTQGTLGDQLKAALKTAKDATSSAVSNLRDGLIRVPLTGDTRRNVLEGIADSLNTKFDNVFTGDSRIEFNVTLGPNPQIEALTVSTAGMSKADVKAVQEALDQVNSAGTIGELFDARQFIQKDFGKAEDISGRIKSAVQSGVSDGVKGIDAAVDASDRVFSSTKQAFKIVEEAGKTSKRSATGRAVEGVDHGKAALNMPVTQRQMFTPDDIPLKNQSTPEAARQLALRRTLAIADDNTGFINAASDFEVLPDGTIRYGLDEWLQAADAAPTRLETDILNKSTGLQLAGARPNDTGMISTAQGSTIAVAQKSAAAAPVAPALIAGAGSPSISNAILQAEAARRRFAPALGPQQAASLITRPQQEVSPSGPDIAPLFGPQLAR